MSKFLHLDIMKGGQYVCTLHMPHCQAFKLRVEDVADFVERKRPSLKGKDYNVIIE